MMTIVFLFIGCYFIGSIPFGLLIGKINKIDIREHGSGNIGATNVLRTLGKKWGIPCFLLDFLKGCLPVLIGKALILKSDAPENIQQIAIPLLVFATVGGHVFSLFLKFKGGKGVATSAGAIMALAPHAVLAVLVVWFILLKAFGYVSLASIIGGAALPFLALITNALGWSKLGLPTIVILFVLAFLVVISHKANIKRLLDGTESSFKKKKD